MSAVDTCPHEIQLNHSFFYLFSDEMMSDVDVFRPGVLNIVAAKKLWHFVVISQRDCDLSLYMARRASLLL
ncbi:hypothetical protein Tco_1490742 [Tanacetum coccineum]